MESTLVMAAKNNSDLLMFGFKVNAASYQMVSNFDNIWWCAFNKNISNVSKVLYTHINLQ